MKEIQDNGVIVVLSFVVDRLDFYINSRVQRYNKLLFNYCSENLIIFIKHDNILAKHYNRDGLHLNYDGAHILCDNVVKCIDLIIPYCFGK